MIQPFAKDEVFLASLEEPPRTPDELRVWWLGQSGFLLRWQKHRLLLDPYLSDSLTYKYAGTDKPHVRMTERVIAPERLTRIEYVFSTHNHTDHLDAETLIPLRKANPECGLVFPEANRAFLEQRLGPAMHPSLGINDTPPEPADREGSAIPASRSVLDFSFGDNGAVNSAADPVVITAVPAAHNELERDEQGRCRFLGYVVQLGPWRVYHSGDTLLYPGLAERLRALGPIHLALLPINGNKPERRVAGNLDGREAAELAHHIGAGLVVPCHYEMFEFNTADPRALFIPECERLAQPYRILRAGESLTLP